MHYSPDKVACQSRAKDGAVPCSVRVDLIACDTKLLEDDWFVGLVGSLTTFCESTSRAKPNTILPSTCCSIHVKPHSSAVQLEPGKSFADNISSIYHASL